MNQLVNMAAKIRYMSSGEHSVPLVVRAAIGRSWGQGAQHSQAFHSYFMHIPGIKVVAPTTPHDAKGCLIASIRDNNPVIFVEHRMLYSNTGFVPNELYEVEFGKGRVLVEGTDITLVGVSYTVTDCIRAALALKEIGISAEVIDPVSLSPIDYEIIRKSANKTKKVLVVDNGWLTCGFSSEVIADLGINCSDLNLDRMGYLESPCPTTRVLEDGFYPNPENVAIKANQMCNGDKNWKPEKISREEINSFKGTLLIMDNKKNLENAIKQCWNDNPSNEFDIDKPIVRLHEPTFNADEIIAFTNQMLTTKVTMGEKVTEFEKKYCSKYSYGHGVSNNSGSSANLLMLSVLTSKLTENI